MGLVEVQPCPWQVAKMLLGLFAPLLGLFAPLQALQRLKAGSGCSWHNPQQGGHSAVPAHSEAERAHSQPQGSCRLELAAGGQGCRAGRACPGHTATPAACLQPLLRCSAPSGARGTCNEKCRNAAAGMANSILSDTELLKPGSYKLSVLTGTPENIALD